MADPGPDATCVDWFLTFKKLPREQPTLPQQEQTARGSLPKDKGFQNIVYIFLIQVIIG